MKIYDLEIELYNEDKEYKTDYLSYKYTDMESAFINYITQFEMVVFNKNDWSKDVKSITLKENKLIVISHNFKKEQFYIAPSL
jgi:hypothetical protein